jgi:hypothetical protein
MLLWNKNKNNFEVKKERDSLKSNLKFKKSKNTRRGIQGDVSFDRLMWVLNFILFIIFSITLTSLIFF